MLGFIPIKNFLTAAVDLMAAVPSIIYGMWGFFVLMPHTTGLETWLSSYFGFIPYLQEHGGHQHLKPVHLRLDRRHHVHADHHLTLP